MTLSFVLVISCSFFPLNLAITMCTKGIVVALLGREMGAGYFHVNYVLEAGPLSQLEMSLKSGLVMDAGLPVHNFP